MRGKPLPGGWELPYGVKSKLTTIIVATMDKPEMHNVEFCSENEVLGVTLRGNDYFLTVQEKENPHIYPKLRWDFKILGGNAVVPEGYLFVAAVSGRTVFPTFLFARGE